MHNLNEWNWFSFSNWSSRTVTQLPGALYPLLNVGDFIVKEIKIMEGQYVTASEHAQGHHQTASLTVLRLRFLVPVGVHFIANSGSISQQIQAVKVTNPFIFPYDQQLWFHFIPLTCIACFYSHMRKFNKSHATSLPAPTKFVRWLILFVGPRYGTCFMSLFWRPALWDDY